MATSADDDANGGAGEVIPPGPAAGWARLSGPQRQALVDALALCEDLHWAERLRAIVPVDPGADLRARRIRRRGGLAVGAGVAAGAGLLASGFAWGAALLVTAPVLPTVVLWASQRARLEGAVRPSGPPDLERLLEAVAVPRGDGWDELHADLARAASSPDLVQAFHHLHAGDWGGRLVGWAALRPNPTPAYSVLEWMTGVFRAGSALSRFDRHLVDDLLGRIPAPPPGLEAEELAVCRRCLSRWQGVASVRLWYGSDRPFAACRRCGKGGPPLPAPVERIVAVLGRRGDPWPEQVGWPEGTHFEPGPASEGGVLGIDVRPRLEARAPFDLDRVEIRGASDAEVEAFCILAGNDPDPLQQRRTRAAPVTLAPGAAPSANTLAILERTFGEIQGTPDG